MKVLTIKQPWATLIAEGYKKYEFRTWNTKFRGTLLIHAGKGIDKKALERFKHLNLEYPTGCIIAKCEITDSIYIDDEMRAYLKKEDPLVYRGVVNHPEWEGYGFKIDNVEKIKPIPINGKLSLWDYDYKE